MKQDILLVGEGSLLKFKLASILSRSRRVYQCYSVDEAESFLRNNQVDCTIFCDHYFTEFAGTNRLENGGNLICLTSRYAVGAIPPQPSDSLQIIYDQLYGFSGYSASGTSTMQILYTGQKIVHPVLVDDIAFWLSHHADCTGLYYLRGPETVTGAGFLQAITMEIPTYETVGEGQKDADWPGVVVRLRHTLSQGINVARHQKSCAVNLIYKLPLHTPVAGTTVEAVRERLGALAAERVPESIRKRLDYVCPVPNSGIPYAKSAAAALNLPLVSAVEKLTSARSFHIEDQTVRGSMIAGNMKIEKDQIRGAKICLVDEAIFTGTTLRILCRMLRSCGAAELHVLIPTPPCTAQCPYCSIPTRPMLLEQVTLADLPDELGVDSIWFQTKETLSALLQTTDMQCCDCFS